MTEGTETSLKDAIAREIDDLPEEEQADVLAFVRFLKLGAGDLRSVEARFAAAIERARDIAAERGITLDDISAEIDSVRTSG